MTTQDDAALRLRVTVRLTSSGCEHFLRECESSLYSMRFVILIRWIDLRRIH